MLTCVQRVLLNMKSFFFIFKDSEREKFSLNSVRFEQFFIGEPPKFDISFGRGKFSKLSQLNSSNVKIIKQTCKSSANNNNKTNVNGLNKIQQKKPTNTSASAKLSSKIKKKYSKQKSSEDIKQRLASNKTSKMDDTQRKIAAAEKQHRMTEAKKIMNKKSKLDFELHAMFNYYCYFP